MIQFTRTTKQEIIVDPQLLEQFSDEPSNEGPRPCQPLPLEQVLKNVEQIHVQCNGHHVCGLPVHLQTFDLNHYLRLVRASRLTVTK